MENKNAVPDRDERADEQPGVGGGAAGQAPRPASRASDTDIPEFLKGPDPEDADPASSESAPSEPAASEAARSGNPASDRDDWEAAFEDASVPGSGDAAADRAHNPTGNGSPESSSVENGPAGTDARTEAIPGGATPLAAAVAADHDASHTQALPAWDQEDSGTRAMPAVRDDAVDGDTRDSPSRPTADSDAGDPVPGPAGDPTDADEQDAGEQDARDHGTGDRGATTAAGAAAAGGAGATAVTAATAPDTEAEDSQRTDAVAAAKRRGGTPRNSDLDADPEAQRRHEAREAALTAKPMFARVVQTLLAIAFPFMLVIAAIRAVASPWFLWLEYNRPGFPADTYGFSPAERLTYGNYGVDYINNSAPSAYLGNLMDANGNPLFLATEVSHMADVKAVVGATYAAGAILFVLAVLACLYLGRRYAGGMRRAFFAGSVATLVVMIALTVLAVLNFQTFFTDFHELFFSQGNWTFHANDTLIRLYPTQFWVDAGIVIAALVLVTSLIFLVTTWPTRRRRERSRLLQVNRDLGLD